MPGIGGIFGAGAVLAISFPDKEQPAALAEPTAKR